MLRKQISAQRIFKNHFKIEHTHTQFQMTRLRTEHQCLFFIRLLERKLILFSIIQLWIIFQSKSKWSENLILISVVIVLHSTSLATTQNIIWKTSHPSILRTLNTHVTTYLLTIWLKICIFLHLNSHWKCWFCDFRLIHIDWCDYKINIYMHCERGAVLSIVCAIFYHTLIS